MKLIDLHPAFIDGGGDGITRDGQTVPRRTGVGLHCDCPCGTADCFLYVPFKNPLDGGGSHGDDHAYWQRTGETFETLTLHPSIKRIGGCRWHGWITNGIVKGRCE